MKTPISFLTIAALACACSMFAMENKQPEHKTQSTDIPTAPRREPVANGLRLEELVLEEIEKLHKLNIDSKTLKRLFIYRMKPDSTPERS